MSNPQPADTRDGRVVVNFGVHCLVETPAHELVRCHVPRRLLRPVCGDFVRWAAATGPDQGVLTGIQPRRNELRRHDVRAQSRVLAANLDLLLVVLAATPKPDLALIDRYLVGAELLKLEACLLFNKYDLLSGDDRHHWQSTLAEYERLGYSLIFTSVKSARGIDDARKRLQSRTGIVVGQSGVGKSSLVAALIPDLGLRTQTLSEASGAGQHTTSTTRLYPLPGHQGCIIDSPGVRDFRLWPVALPELTSGFREIRAAEGECRFPDCRHLQEPGCEIRRRVESAEISPRRYASYCQLAEWMSKTRVAGSRPSPG